MELNKSTDQNHHSDTTTHGIRVQVFPTFIPPEQTPDEAKYFFSYRVVIMNTSEKSVQLLSRRWIIIDADGHEETVEGKGVIGQQPILQPDEKFSYSSFCPIDTPWGTMEGKYQFSDDNDSLFDVEVGRFYLVAEEE